MADSTNVHDPDNTSSPPAEEEELEVRSIILVGRTGAGKSQLCRYLATTEGHGDLRPSAQFRASDGLDSETVSIDHAIARVTTLSGSGVVRVIDTPGFSDSRGDDQTNIRRIVEAVRRVDDCAAIIIVLDASNMRLSADIRTMLEYFRDILGTSVLSNLVFAFSRCNEKQVERFRQKPGKYAGAWSQKVCEIWGVEPVHIPSFYLNSRKDDDAIPYADVHEEELDKMMITCYFNSLIQLAHAREIDTKEVTAEKAIEAQQAAAKAAEARADHAAAETERLKKEGEAAQRMHEQNMQRMRATISQLSQQRGRKGGRCLIL